MVITQAMEGVGDGGSRRRKYMGLVSALVLFVVVIVVCLNSSMVSSMQQATTAQWSLAALTTSNSTDLQPNSSGLSANHLAVNRADFPAAPTAPRRLAYMLYATDARTVCNALIMARNIRATGTPMSIPIVTLVASDVAPDIAKQLVDPFNNFVVEVVAPWQQSRVHLSHEYASSLTKLRIFEERGGFDKVIYLDSDAWVQRNLDHLFHLGNAVLWAPHAYYIRESYVFGSTLLVFSPSNDVVAALAAALETPPRPNYFDMDVLNDLFRLDCGYLPNHYVVLSYTLNDDVTWSFKTKEDRMANTYVYHFSPGLGVGKPWQTPRSILSDMDQAYEPLFYDLFARYWQQEDTLCASWLR
ncbi:hypothetical protein B5M09_013695 [Aphanomyces astaci]|uniref:Nucleotide-diphospho-sugar transferase domain-containing protein n=1 Tax=Aphanomyces astaci TaxID=112090 RepID=A0A3R7WPG9_APHAT|nr:hypothetical protein B5M09_013695 [Aphanomyces astaci]